MKSIYYSIILIFSVFFTLIFSSCVDEEMITPNASFRLSNQTNTAAEYTCFAGETFYVVKTGAGEFMTLYDGNTGKIWGQSGASGIQFQLKDSLPVTYNAVGSYTLTVVASSAGKFGEKYEQNIDSVKINVIDRRSALTSFSLLLNGTEYKGVIDGEKNIIIPLPDVFTDSLSSVKPLFVTSSNQAKVYVGSVLQESGKTIQNLTGTLTYKVVAPSGDYVEYKVSADTFPSSSEKKITQFKLVNDKKCGNGEVGVIDEDNKTISIVLNYGTPADKLKVNIISSVASTYLYNGLTAFGTYTNLSGAGSNPLTSIKVIAQNKSEQTYTVTATQEPPFKSFTFKGLNPVPITVIDNAAKTITVKVFKGTDITKLVAEWTGTLGDVKIGSTKQVSGTTVNDFSNPKQYKLYKGSTNSDTYTISVIVLE